MSQLSSNSHGWVSRLLNMAVCVCVCVCSKSSHKHRESDGNPQTEGASFTRNIKVMSLVCGVFGNQIFKKSLNQTADFKWEISVSPTDQTHTVLMKGISWVLGVLVIFDYVCFLFNLKDWLMPIYQILIIDHLEPRFQVSEKLFSKHLQRFLCSLMASLLYM